MNACQFSFLINGDEGRWKFPSDLSDLSDFVARGIKRKPRDLESNQVEASFATSPQLMSLPGPGLEPATFQTSIKMSTTELTQCPSCPRRYLSKTAFDFHLQTHREDTLAMPESDLADLTRTLASPGLSDNSLKSQISESPSEGPNAGSGNAQVLLTPQETTDQATTDETSFKVEEPMPGREIEPKPSSLGHSKSTRGAERQFKCNCCDKYFRHKSALNCHVQTVHEKMKPLKCQHCGKSFSQKSSLQLHLKTIHEKLRPFQCQQCGKSFVRKDYFQLHFLRARDKTKLFEC